MNKYRTIVIRISLSIIAGVIVALIATASAWRSIGSRWNFHPEYEATRHAVYELQELIRLHRATAKALPGSLPELRRTRDRHVTEFQWNEADMPLDGWGRPFVYVIEGDRYMITSLGRDGKPGGIGLDSDLSTTDLPIKEASPTFGQFIRLPLARGALVTCLACGVLTFVVSLTVVKPSELRGRGLAALAVKLIATCIGAILVASFLAMFHIPNHH